MDGSPIAFAISALLGGGLLQAILAIYKAIGESKEKKALAETVEAKTPAEVESVSIATMSTALTAAQGRISTMEEERQNDHAYYNQIIKDLKEQLQKVHDELEAMKRKVAELLRETQKHIENKDSSREG